MILAFLKTKGIDSLNMLRPLNINPLKSVYNEIWGNFDYNETPLAPPGCLIIANNQAQGSKIWIDHSIQEFFIGPAKNHHWCYNVYIPTTR